MKHLFSIIAFFACIAGSFNATAQCAPDSTLTTTATRPDFLDTAKVNVPYTQVIQFYITKDTVVYVPQLGQTLNTRIDTLWITGVTGIPSGFTYNCHNADCKILGGAAGCVTISGTPGPNTGGIYPLLVLIKIRATAMLGIIPVAQTVNDTNARYFIVIDGPSGMAQLKGEEPLLVYPNPAKDLLQIALTKEQKQSSFVLLTQQGSTVATGELEGAGVVNQIQTDNLPQGIYYLKVISDDRVLTRTISILR